MDAGEKDVLQEFEFLTSKVGIRQDEKGRKPIAESQRFDSVRFIQTVAARVRVLCERSRAAESSATLLVKKAELAVQAAENRVRQAEALTIVATARARQAEDELRVFRQQLAGSESLGNNVDTWLTKAHSSLRYLQESRSGKLAE